MIVRILGEDQYELKDEAVEHLGNLDQAIDDALSTGDDAAFQLALAKLIAAVRSEGRRVDPDEIVPSDLVLPHEGASLDEVRGLLPRLRTSGVLNQ